MLRTLRARASWYASLANTLPAILTCYFKIRSIYRMVDFSLGRTGYTERHEWCVYVFDALAIFPVVVLYIWWHPGMYLPYLGIRLPKHAR
jgi:hypothetical protein